MHNYIAPGTRFFQGKFTLLLQLLNLLHISGYCCTWWLYVVTYKSLSVGCCYLSVPQRLLGEMKQKETAKQRNFTGDLRGPYFPLKVKH